MKSFWFIFENEPKGLQERIKMWRRIIQNMQKNHVSTGYKNIASNFVFSLFQWHSRSSQACICLMQQWLIEALNWNALLKSNML